jgi:hypothetical protein
MGEISKLNCLIRLVKHFMCVDFLYFLNLLLVLICKILTSSLPVQFLHKDVGTVLIRPEDLPQDCV